MQALMVENHGGPEALIVTDVARPEIRPDEVLVRVRAAGVNHLDLWVRRGVEGHAFPLPMILGCDGAGEVEAVGEIVSNAKPGDRVAVSPGYSCGVCEVCLDGRQNLCRRYGIFGEMRNGTAAEYISVPARNLLPIPEGMTFEEAAALPLAALTAHHMLVERAGLEPGQQVLIHAAGSGVSTYAIQIARLLGARVIATASTEAKRRRALDLGADVVLDNQDPQWSRRVYEESGRQGVDVVIDHVGEATITSSLRCLRRGGALVTCGATSGPRLEADLRLIFFKNLSILGSTMGGMGEMLHVWRLASRGLIRPIVDKVLPLSRAREAHAAMERRETFGKIVLKPGE